MKLDNHKENYKSVRIKTDTYKKLRHLAIEMEIPITKLIELMYDKFIL